MVKVEKIFFSLLLATTVAGCQNQEQVAVTNVNKSEAQKVVEKAKQSETNPTYNLENLTVANQYGTVTPFNIATETKDWVFFTNDKELWAETRDTTKERILLDEVTGEYDSIFSVSYDRGWIYYKKNFEIWKVRPDGNEKQKIAFSDTKDHSINEIIVYQDKLFFISHEETGVKAKQDLLYVADADGNNVKLLTPDNIGVNHINIANNKLYYSVSETSKKDVLFEIDLKHPNYQSKRLLESNQLNRFQILNDWVFYTENDRLHKQRLQGDEYQQIGVESCSSFVIYKDKIYYENEGQVFRMNMDGSHPQQIVGDVDPTPGPKFIRYAITSDFVYSIRKGMDNKVNLYLDQLDLLEPTPSAREQVATEYADDAAYSELKKLYDQVLSENKPIRISDLQERETPFSGGSELFPNDHIIGAAKSLVFGLTYPDKEFLRKIVQNTNTLEKLFRYSEVFRMTDEVDGGYSDYSIFVEKDGTVTVKGGTVEANITFINIGNRYYFEKMKVSKLAVKTN
jgi:hypothetical protein